MQDRIHGTTMPVLEISLEPNETIVAESGELSWMTQSVVMQTTTQGAGGGGLFGAAKRSFAGGTFFMTGYTAVQAPGMVAFAAKLPGQIFPVEVVPQPGMGYLAHRHGYVCGTPGVALGIGFQQRLGAGIFGGEGFRLQHITGQGRAWVELSGEVVVYDLRPGEVLRVHPGHVGLFQESVRFGITTVKGIKNKLFGGDGIFLAEMTGPGRLWLQSLPISRLAHALSPYLVGASVEGGAGAGAAGAIAGSVLRGLSR
ncbi:MAG: hypothetical protein NVSMB29_06900 [Candidatus Dormibacteria bacterium]